MCRPNPLDTIRLKMTLDTVRARAGSSQGLSNKKYYTLLKDTQGVAQGPDPLNKDHFLVLFERENSATLVASISHVNMKGLEPSRKGVERRL